MDVLKNSEYDLKLGDGAIVGLGGSMTRLIPTIFCRARRLGDVVMRYRRGSCVWTQVDTKKLAADGQARVTDPGRWSAIWREILNRRSGSHIGQQVRDGRRRLELDDRAFQRDR